MAKEQAALFRYNLKRLLKNKGWDLHTLAEESGIGLGTLRKYSAGYREPKVSFREILADTFGVNDEEFYRTPNETNFNSSAAQKTVTEKTQKRIDALSWELNLDMENALEKDFLKKMLPILPELKNVPVEILELLTKIDSISHNHILEELKLLIQEEPPPDPPKIKMQKKAKDQKL